MNFFAVLGCDAYLEWIFAKIYWWYRPRQPAYQIKLMLSRVSWALAQISCSFCACFTFRIMTSPYRTDGRTDDQTSTCTSAVYEDGLTVIYRLYYSWFERFIDRHSDKVYRRRHSTYRPTGWALSDSTGAGTGGAVAPPTKLLGEQV